MRIKQSRFINNTGWMIAERVYQMGVSLVVGMLTARYLGPTNFGVINYIAAFISFVTPICNLGFDEVLIKKYKDMPEKQSVITGTAMLFEFATSFFVSIILVILINRINTGDREKTIITILQSFYLLFKSTEPIEFWYQSRLESKFTSTIKMIGYTCMSLYRIVLLVMAKPVIWFSFASSLDMLVIAVLYLSLYKRQRLPRLRINFEVGKAIISESYHFIISGLMVVIYSQIDKIMIQQMLGDHQVGLYSAGHTVCTLWLFVPTALIASAKPLIFEEKKRNEDMYLRRLKQLYAAVFWMGICVGAFFSLFSSHIIRLLYGIEYVEASSSLAIGIWYGTFAMLGSARSIWILCENRSRYIKHILFVGAVTNIILNNFWIKTWGINGAALATLVTQVVTSMFAPLLFKETRIHTKIVIDALTFNW